jgi:hypothetical protein
MALKWTALHALHCMDYLWWRETRKNGHSVFRVQEKNSTGSPTIVGLELATQTQACCM